MAIEGYEEDSLGAAFDYLVQSDTLAKAFMVKIQNLPKRTQMLQLIQVLKLTYFIKETTLASILVKAIETSLEKAVERKECTCKVEVAEDSPFRRGWCGFSHFSLVTYLPLWRDHGGELESSSAYNTGQMTFILSLSDFIILNSILGDFELGLGEFLK
ncbi:hypothetical protein HAX54_026177, partial [Datura stramonium]|nr:hypothetical protein [Datura stramonium]